jgi:meso-butanediol dehydrogenase/(S,S)-butanediol dehydrogenase/diacetyl reductase
MKDKILDGKVVLVSGTAGGQGRAAALAFAAAGARVVGCDVKVHEAEETVALVKAAGGDMRSLQPLDPSDPKQAEAWVHEATAAYKGVDVLYNNAGSHRTHGPFSESSLEDWYATLRFELTIAYVSTRQPGRISSRGAAG